MQEFHEMRLIVLLRFVLLRPRLTIAFLNCNCFGYSLRLTVVYVLALESDFDRKNMLASLLPILEVRATARRGFRIRIDRVFL